VRSALRQNSVSQVSRCRLFAAAFLQRQRMKTSDSTVGPTHHCHPQAAARQASSRATLCAFMKLYTQQREAMAPSMLFLMAGRVVAGEW